MPNCPPLLIASSQQSSSKCTVLERLAQMPCAGMEPRLLLRYWEGLRPLGEVFGSPKGTGAARCGSEHPSPCSPVHFTAGSVFQSRKRRGAARLFNEPLTAASLPRCS